MALNFASYYESDLDVCDFWAARASSASPGTREIGPSTSARQRWGTRNRSFGTRSASLGHSKLTARARFTSLGRSKLAARHCLGFAGAVEITAPADVSDCGTLKSTARLLEPTRLR